MVFNFISARSAGRKIIMKKVSNKLILGVCCSTLLAWSSQTFSSDTFIVKGIRVNGLQRVSTGTVLNYMPVQVGEKSVPAQQLKLSALSMRQDFSSPFRLNAKGMC